MASNLAEVTKNYLTKYPTTPNLTLAKLIRKENPRLKRTVEQWRTSIRNQRQVAGKNSRLHMPDTFQWQTAWAEHRNKFIQRQQQVPDPFHLPAKNRRILFFADVHHPYSDEAALDATINYGLQHNFNTIYINGDFCDNHNTSRWFNGVKQFDTAEEIYLCRELLEMVRKTFPKADIYFKEGNHDMRLENYLAINSEQVIGIQEFTLRSLLNLDQQRITFIDNKQLAYIGRLAAIHGHEYRFAIANPVNPARGLFLRAKESTIESHFHQGSKHAGRTIGGSRIICWSTGCLCNLRPEYTPFNEWGHGFADIEVSADGDYTVTLRDIIKGRVH